MKSIFVIILNLVMANAAFAAISEAEFNTVIQIFQKNYSGIEFQGSWMNDTVNAQAMRFDESKLIVVYGGLGREEAANIDSFSVMLCHEVGHHLGGKPYFPGWNGQAAWASAEGAADYYSIHECFEKIAAELPAQKMQLPATQESTITQICQSTANTSVCRRAVIAGLLISYLQWHSLPGDNAQPELGKSEQNFPKSVLLDYPTPQCRLDTFIASALNIDRPRCWFGR